MLHPEPDDRDPGVRAFRERLERVRFACADCGFEDALLHSDWEARAETDPRDGGLRYRLTCPNCRAERLVDVDL